MHISELDYHLPEGLIAQHPSARRDRSRLMLVNRAEGSITHLRFDALPELLRSGDRLVLNDTKVRACRLYLQRAKTGGRVELFLLDEESPGLFSAMTRAGGKLSEGEALVLDQGDAGLRVTLLERLDGGVWRVKAETISGQGSAPTFADLEAFGRMPLPPYIHRERSVDDPFAEEDRERYQTVFAEKAGAVAAPTAGLHFTRELLARLMDVGVPHSRLTLHVGIGTFRPVSEEQVEDHPMHSETFEVSKDCADEVNATKGRVIAVGSTATRTLEAVAAENGTIPAGAGATDLMILPGYEFKSLGGMITNFHLPKSTLMALVMAFAGVELTREAYRQAVAEEYRFFSYGDAMLIL